MGHLLTLFAAGGTNDPAPVSEFALDFSDADNSMYAGGLWTVCC